MQSLRRRAVGTAEPLDSLIGSALANQRGVWEGAEVTMVKSSYHNEPESTQRECEPNHSHLSRMLSI